MTNIERITLPKIISMLNACNFKFAIIDSDGNKHGDLEIVARKKRRPLQYPIGTLSSHFLPYIKNLVPDQAAEIPCLDYDPETIRGSIAAWTSKHWGNGVCSTLVDRETNTVLVFRTQKNI